MSERLDASFPESSWRGHTFRYRLASGFLSSGDTVLDAACGIGYGAELLVGDRSVTYCGVDADLEFFEAEHPAIEADLTDWEPSLEFDVFVGFETIEHLPSYDAYIGAAKRAKKWLILSTPIVPTTHLNPWHKHNFAPGEVASLIVDQEWKLYQGLLQPSELSEIYVFQRRKEEA